MFINTVQHIQQYGPELGIEIIAANYGAGGTGFQFWDQGTPPGPRTWIVARFHSASMGKFDMLLYQVSASSGQTLGGVVMSQQVNSFAGSNRLYGSFGASFACHPSGSNTGSADGPWNGSYSLTSATLGIGNSGLSANNPLWKTTADSKGAFFPRANGIAGTYSASRNYLATLNEDGAQVGTEATFLPARYHILLSEDSFTFLVDHANDTSYKVTHFGPYFPRSGSTPYPESPYYMFTNSVSTVNPVGAFYTQGNIGQTAGVGGGVSTPDGAVAHPNLLSGALIFGHVTIGGLDSIASYTNFVNSGSFEKIPMWVAISEGTNNGILGLAKHVAWGYGMNSNSISYSSSSAAMGLAEAQGVKIIIPWSGSAPGTNWQHRTGRIMNFDV
jgi:hypothetical protein